MFRKVDLNYPFFQVFWGRIMQEIADHVNRVLQDQVLKCSGSCTDENEAHTN